jgi:hypothetical protein
LSIAEIWWWIRYIVAVVYKRVIVSVQRGEDHKPGFPGTTTWFWFMEKITFPIWLYSSGDPDATSELTSATRMDPSSTFAALKQELISILSTPQIPDAKATVERINFAPDIPEYDGLYAVVLDSVFTPAECNALVRVAEASSAGPSGVPEWQPAMIDVGGGRQRYEPDARDCGRILWDDRAVVEAILNRVRTSVPELEFLDANSWTHVTGSKACSWRMTR